MSDWLEIRPGGVLMRIQWEYDEEADKGAYVETDVTEFAFRYLFDECHLHPDVILRDVFALLKKHLDLFTLVLDSRLPLLIDEMNNPVAQDAKDEEVEWLELYWSLATEEVFEDMRTPGDRLRPTGKKGINGNLFPGFHGKGFVDDEGYRENYSIAFSPANELMGLPLRLSQEFLLFDEHEWMKRFSDEEGAAEREKKPEAYQTKFEGCPYSLGGILHGILWEMLWNSTPTERKEHMDELKSRVEEIRREFGPKDDDAYEHESASEASWQSAVDVARTKRTIQNIGGFPELVIAGWFPLFYTENGEVPVSEDPDGAVRWEQWIVAGDAYLYGDGNTYDVMCEIYVDGKTDHEVRSLDDVIVLLRKYLVYTPDAEIHPVLKTMLEAK